MAPNSTGYDAHSVETEVLSFWKARRLPPVGGVLGPGTGPTVHQYLGAWTKGDFPSLIAHRAVVADVDARYLSLAGRRAVGTLRQASGPGTTSPSAVPALLDALGVWVGGDGPRAWDSDDRAAGVQVILGRLAAHGSLVTRDEAFRICPTCGSPRSPERIIYQEEEGDTYLVQFPIRVENWTVDALVWVDAPWKLLGTSALLLNPENRYVVAGYRRREVRELVLTSAGSLHRLRTWIPEASFEVVQEKPGREFQGIAYTYPLRHEFPMGGDLVPPAGTILAAPDVSESGTGIVPLVPGHGATDARIANRLGVSGWPLLTPKGKLDFTLMHKYAGLDLETANEFVVRDLSEAGALLAHLRVKRGVPHCAVCGSALLWTPGRAWCLEPARLPAESRALFARLLPTETLPSRAEAAPWPVSEAVPGEEPGAFGLFECARCERLGPPDGPAQCPCGGPRTLVRRRLLPSIGSALSAWARFDPIPEGNPVHIYVSDRRRLPSLINHLAAMSGVAGAAGEVNLTIVPSVATEEAARLAETLGADAVRAALIRAGAPGSGGGRFVDRCRQEHDRIRRWWDLSRDVASRCDLSLLASFSRPIDGFLGELEVEDRAILARWERTRSSALAHYDSHAPALAYRRALHFVDNDLTEYRALVESRLALPGTPNSKRGALRTLAHLLRSLSEVLAPVLPFSSESIHRSLSTERTSLFERPAAGPDRSLLNDDLVSTWDRWRTVLRAVARFRRSLGIPPSTVLPSLVLVLAADDVADRYRAEREPLARLARVQRFEIGSPREPWAGRQRTVRPVESEIQKAYPSQASQVIHLLQRMPPRRWETALGQEDLSVVVDGLPRRIFPSMVAFSDTLPPRFLPAAWPGGEMYVELPAGTSEPSPMIPPLSSNAYWLVRRLRHRLRAEARGAGPVPRVAVVTAKDPLASELKAVAAPIATYLGIDEFRVALSSEEPLPPGAIVGRTRTGDAWWVGVPGIASRPPRHKPPKARTHVGRVVVAAGPSGPEEFDYADPAFVAHEEEVRALGQQLDDLLGLPLLGPSKVSAAWDQGIKSVDDLRNIPFDSVSALPGFGPSVAEVVVTKLGGFVPPREVRIPRPPVAPRELSSTPVPRTVPSPPAAPSPAAAVAGGPPGIPAPQPLPKVEIPPPTRVPSGGTPAEPARTVPGPVPSAPAEPVPPAEAPTGPPTVPEPLVIEPPETPAPTSERLEPPSPSTGGREVAEELPSAEPIEPAVTASVPPSPPISEERPPPSPHPPAPEELPAEPIPELPEGPLPLREPEEEETGATVGENLETPAPPETALPAEAGASPSEMAVPEPASPEGPAEAAAPTEAPAEEAVASLPLPSPETPLVPSSENLPAEVVEVEEEPNPETAEAPPGPSGEEEAPGTLPPGESGAVVPGAAPSPTEVPSDSVPQSPVAVEPELSVVPTVAPPAPAAEPAGPSPPSPEAPPPVEPAIPEVAPPPEPPGPPTGVELTVSESLVGALGGFLESTAAGHRGVCVVREPPERIRARVGSRPIEVLWLSNIGRGPALRPSDLEGLWTFLNRKLTEERVTAFFFEGIEYLVRLHGADAVLTGLVQFDRLARENDARVWVCLTPALMRAADFERFRETFGGVTPSA